MENKFAIFVAKRLHFSNILHYIWTLRLKKILDCVWIWTEFKKIRTGSRSQNMTVRSSLIQGYGAGAPELVILPGAGVQSKNQKEPDLSSKFRTGAGVMAI